jgi:hypothetical protein
MIPREILKKIRQFEIRTNRIVTETLAGVWNTKAGIFNRERGQRLLLCSRILRGSRLNPYGQ